MAKTVSEVMEVLEGSKGVPGRRSRAGVRADPARKALPDVAVDGSEDECEPLDFSVVPRDKPVSSYSTREVGLEGEAIAASYLVRRGYEVVDRNWRCVCGEADVVARDGDETVLVEVKTRVDRGGDPLAPELAVGVRKRQTYTRLALMYVSLHPEVTNVRFDVIAVTLRENRSALLRHLVGAFCWDEQ
ncbi:MAG: YraN family protein [Olsenella sp.]|nr:YraN family protein [Olsenella sp.]